MTQVPFFYMAPLRGITDAMYRNIFASHFSGLNCAVAPFLNPQKDPSNKTKPFEDLFAEKNRCLTVIPQLLNNDVVGFLATAKHLEELGYTTLNWNLGCPAPMVANKGRGSGLLPYPDEIVSLLEEVLPRINATLSIKMRLGYHEKSESIALLSRLNDFPLEEIIIHPRLGKQMYRGKTDLDGFAACMQCTNHTLVYNGDIISREIFADLTQRFPTISRWMIGRGILENPLLIEELRGRVEENPTERLGRIRAFHDDIAEGYRQKLSGPGHLLGKMKQLWIYLASSFPGKDKVLKKIKKARNEQQLFEAIDRMFE